MITGATRVAAVIGHPVAHSLSPAIHRAGFASLGADWAYVAFDVAPGRAAEALLAVRTLGLGGLSVTMPHKHDVAAAVDRLEPAAAALGSANTVSVGPDGELVGASTDGDGFVASLADADVDLAGARLGVVGAGGAARSILDAVARAGAAEVLVANRTVERATEIVPLAGGIARVATLAELVDCDVVVNTTPLGMGGQGGLPVDPAQLRPGTVVVDIVYHPLRTPLLVAAGERGCRTVDGLGMLVHQAALQQLRWVGQMPDVAEMRAEAERQLAERGQ